MLIIWHFYIAISFLYLHKSVSRSNFRVIIMFVGSHVISVFLGYVLKQQNNNNDSNSFYLKAPLLALKDTVQSYRN